MKVGAAGSLVLLAILGLVLAAAGQSQAPPVAWNKIYGGIGVEEAYSVRQTFDGGYIFLGLTYSFGAGGSGFWLVKTDRDGNKEWDKTFGGPLNEVGRSVRQTQDGGYILLGNTTSKGAGVADLWLIKTDASGNRVWERTYGGSMEDRGYCVQQTTDGGYILVGLTRSKGEGLTDVWLIKTDASGNRKWDKAFGGKADDAGNFVLQTKAGGYILLGYTRSKGAGRADFWLVKTTPEGERSWDKTFGGSADDFGYVVRQTQDGGYVLLGDTESEGAGSVDYRLIKVTPAVAKEWDRTYGGERDDWSYSVQQAADGGYILYGHTRTKGAGRTDAWLVKTNASGIREWDMTLGTATGDYGRAVRQTADGGYILVGYTSSYGAQGEFDAWLVKVSATGK
jgi:hypothetical protein